MNMCTAKDPSNGPPRKNPRLSPQDQAALKPSDQKLRAVPTGVGRLVNGNLAGGIFIDVGNPMLSENDRRGLADLHSCLSVVRDRVRGVALGHHTGFYLFGRPAPARPITSAGL